MLSLGFDSDAKVVTATSESGIAGIEVYGINGTLQKSSGAGIESLSLQDLGSGVALVRAYDNDGNVKSLKVMI